MTETPYTYVHSHLTNPPGLVVASFHSSRGLRWLNKVISVSWECEEDEIEFNGTSFKVQGEPAGWISGDGQMILQAAE